VCAVLNSLKNRQTGYSPNFLANGRENNTPFSLLLENDELTEELDPSPQKAYHGAAYKRHMEHKKIIASVSKKLKCY
jgi:hypothetical protein